MRRLIVRGLACLMLLGPAFLAGCDNKKEADIPKKAIPLPPNGPVSGGPEQPKDK